MNLTPNDMVIALAYVGGINGFGEKEMLKISNFCNDFVDQTRGKTNQEILDTYNSLVKSRKLNSKEKILFGSMMIISFLIEISQAREIELQKVKQEQEKKTIEDTSNYIG